MLREMTAQQFDEWMAYYQIEPFGISAIDFILAHFKALFANTNRKQGKRPFKVEKFLCFTDKQKNADDLFDKDPDEDL